MAALQKVVFHLAVLLLFAVGAATGSPSACFKNLTTLQEGGKYWGVHIGSAIALSHVFNASDPLYNETFAREFDLATPENDCKFRATEPQNGVFQFSRCDRIVFDCFPETSVVRGHNLIWGQGNPAWLINQKYPNTTLAKFLERHVTTVLSHYRNVSRIKCWDVVNEAVSDGAAGQPVFKAANPWYPAVPDYVERAFRAARKAADPSVKLFYNDYAADGMNPKSDRVYQMVKDFKARGVPIDGVGLQMHISYLAYSDSWMADVAANIKRLGELGVEVHITEMDVRCPNCGIENLKLQAKVYANILRACLMNRNVCKSFVVWEFTDRYSWLNRNSDMKSLPFGYNYEKKPAYDAMLDLLNTFSSTEWFWF